MGIVARLAREAHVATPVASAAEQLYLLGEARGLSGSDDSVIATTLTTGGAAAPTPEVRS